MLASVVPMASAMRCCNLEQLGAGGDERGFKARDLLGNRSLWNLAERNFLFLDPVDYRRAARDARRDSNAFEALFAGPDSVTHNNQWGESLAGFPYAVKEHCVNS